MAVTFVLIALAIGAGFITSFAAGAADASGSSAAASRLPVPSRTLIVVLENRAYSRIIGNPAAPYINELARRGRLFTNSFGVTHPSQPNYLALFSGSTQGVRGNECPQAFPTENMASRLLRSGRTFATYSESLPEAGFSGCSAGDYQRKHNPAANWQAIPGPGSLPPTVNQPFTAFPRDYLRLPTVSLVVPDQANDMHDGREPETIRRGDAWLRRNLEGYVRWAEAHDGLFILTFDEDDGSEANRIVTLFAGGVVTPGTYAERIDHFRVLRTVLALYGLEAMGQAASLSPIEGIWKLPQRPGSR